MTAAERGVLLLCCALGDQSVRPLTVARFRTLSLKAAAMGPGDGDPDRDVCAEDLLRLGLNPEEASRVEALLGREEQLQRYLDAGRQLDLYPVTRLSAAYPPQMVQKLGMSCPTAFFCAGNAALFSRPCVGLAGSRRIRPENARFARRVGELAAAEGLTLVTGGAEGADREALEACLRAGGSAVVFVPDDLRKRAHMAGERCLVCSQDGYHLPFTAARALARNAYIHIMGERTLIAQTDLESGGTWSGTAENLKRGWSRVYVFDDGSQGAAGLVSRGAIPVKGLTALAALP